jgi:hypothetical protein
MEEGPKPVIEVTLPLPVFLDLLWGYRKADLRDRAVPGDIIVSALRKIPNIEEHVHFEFIEGSQTIVWQRAEWRRSGEKILASKKESEERFRKVEIIATELKKKVPFLGEDVLRGMGYKMVTEKDYSGLKGFGLDPIALGLL